MKFLIKCCFWLAIVVMVMPTDAKHQAKLYQSADYAVGQAATFCERYPGVCAQGERAWETFKVKAAFAAGLATDMAMEAMFGERKATNPRPVPVREGRQTLSQADRSIPWSQSGKPVDPLRDLIHQN